MLLTTSWQRVAEATTRVESTNVYANTRFYVKYGGRDVTNNRHTIYWEFRAIATPDKSWATYYYNYTKTYSIYDGNTARASGSYKEGTVNTTEKVIASGSWTQEHNANGTWGSNITFNGHVFGESYSQTVYLSLPDIPRQANLLTAQDFNDEGNPVITYENKAGSAVDSLQACISLTGSVDDIEYRDVPKTGTLSYTFELTEEERKLLRKATTSNSRKLFFYLKTVIGSNTFFSRLEQTFTIINADPIFNDFQFNDINEKTVTLTGSDQDIILGYSQVQVTIPVANKAIAQKEATMVNYRFNNTDIPYSDTEDVLIPSTVVNSGEITVYAIDSRQNSTPKIKSAVNVKQYVPLEKGNITAKRENGVSVNTNLSFRGKIDLKDFGAIVNSIKKVVYRYSIAGRNEWSSEYSLEINVDEDGNFSFNGLIAGDIENVGFLIDNAYDIQVYVEDELSKVTFSTVLSSGTPHIAYAKNGVSIMGKYDESVGGLLQVGGQRIDNIAGGGGDTLPVGAIVEYDGTTIPDGYEKVNDNSVLGLTIKGKTYSLGSWDAIDITKDCAELLKNNDGIFFEDGKIKISSNATFKFIDIRLYMKWLIAWYSNLDVGNRGVYLYKNGTRIFQEFITCFHKEQTWFGDSFSWLLEVKPGDYITIAIVRGGTSTATETQIDNGNIKVSAIY